MARELIRQPNGLYAMFTTNRDAFLFINGTRDEVIEYLGGERIQVMDNATRTWESARSANNALYHARGGQPVIMRGDRPVWQGRVVEGVTPLHRDVDTGPVRANPDVAADFLVEPRDMLDAMVDRATEDDFLRGQAAECGVRSIACADLDTGALRDLFAMDMIARGFVTGHGDTLAELHAALWKQIDERG